MFVRAVVRILGLCQRKQEPGMDNTRVAVLVWGWGVAVLTHHL